MLFTALVVAGIAGCPVFPADNYWNAPVSGLPVHPSSLQWVASIGDADLHPDFGGPQYGIPITISKHKPRTKVRFDYADESDAVRYPLRRYADLRLPDDSVPEFFERGREGRRRIEGAERHRVLTHGQTGTHAIVQRQAHERARLHTQPLERGDQLVGVGGVEVHRSI